MHQEDRDRLEAVVAVIQATLASHVVGIYLFGSALLGGLRPFSDLDVLVVVAGPIESAPRRELMSGLLAMRAGRPVEVTIVREDRLKPWRVPPEREFLYGEWLRSAYESGQVPSPEADFDLVAVLATALTASAAVSGPSLTQLLDPISHMDLVSSMRESLPDLRRDLTGDTANVLLTLARMWITAETGEIVAKDVAAGLALERLPAPCRAVLAHARDVYLFSWTGFGLPAAPRRCRGDGRSPDSGPYGAGLYLTIAITCPVVTVSPG